MKIAICEDNNRESALLKAFIKKHLPDSEINVFDNGTSLLEYLQNSKPDTIFLDIEMPGISGIETARKVREMHSGISLVFITGHSDFALQAFEVYAFDYIVKPVDGERLAHTLDRVTKKAEKEEHFIEVRSRGMLFRIRQEDILFIEKTYNKCCIYTNDYMYTAVKPLKYFESLLDDQLFIKTHNAFIVNKNRIASITGRKSQNYEIHFNGSNKSAYLSRGANEKLNLI